MKIICAWCKSVLSDGPGPISHGICGACAGQYAEYYPPSKDPDTSRFVGAARWLLVLFVALLAVGITMWRCR